MTSGRNRNGELCYAAEGLSGAAAPAALQKVDSLMDRAPSGRLFGAISTLSDISIRAAQALEDGKAARERAEGPRKKGKTVARGTGRQKQTRRATR